MENDFEEGLKIERLSADEGGSLAVRGNFEQMKEKITALVEKYSDVEVSEDNLPYIKTLKGHFVSLRTQIEREKRDWKKAYITPVVSFVDSAASELIALASEAENRFASIIDEYDQKRKEELSVIIEEYIEKAMLDNELPLEAKDMFDVKPKFFNKTQKEEDTANDIELQAVHIAKELKKRKMNEELVTKACLDAFLVPDAYLRLLKFQDVSEVLETIEQHRASEKDGEKTKEVTLKISYTKEQAKELTKFLKEKRIKFKILT